jgi:hypothetical protein
MKIISIIFAVLFMAGMAYAQDFELETGDLEVSNIDDAEFIDLRTVRMTIRDVRALLVLARAERQHYNKYINSFTHDITGLTAKRAKYVAARVEVVATIDTLLVTIAELRALAADLQLIPEPVE